jgi:hypothetical protein
MVLEYSIRAGRPSANRGMLSGFTPLASAGAKNDPGRGYAFDGLMARWSASRETVRLPEGSAQETEIEVRAHRASRPVE